MIFNSDIVNMIREVTKLFLIHHLSTNIYVKYWKKVLNKTREIVIIVLVLVFQPPRKGHTFLKEVGCVDLCMDTLHQNNPLVLF